MKNYLKCNKQWENNSDSIKDILEEMKIMEKKLIGSHKIIVSPERYKRIFNYQEKYKCSLNKALFETGYGFL